MQTCANSIFNADPPCPQHPEELPRQVAGWCQVDQCPVLYLMSHIKPGVACTPANDAFESSCRQVHRPLKVLQPEPIIEQMGKLRLERTGTCLHHMPPSGLYLSRDGSHLPWLALPFLIPSHLWVSVHQGTAPPTSL